MLTASTTNKKIIMAIGGGSVVLAAILASLYAQTDKSTLNSLSIDAQQDIPRYTGNPNAPEEIASPLRFESVKVYIFPRDVNKFQDAGELASDIRLTAGIKLAMDSGPDSGASLSGIYDRNGNLVVPNGTDIYISPDFKRPDGSAITIDDLDSGIRYGNGLVVTELWVMSQDSKDEWVLVPAIWLVMGGEDIPKADANMNVIGMTINNHISSQAKYEEAYNDD